MRIAAALFALAATAIVATWAWLGALVEMPQGSLAPGEKLACVSYAPFRGDQNPLGPATRVEPWQIDGDLAQLKALTNCIRTYSTDHGLDQIPEIARRHGMKVLHGLWLSSLPELNRRQIETTIVLANRFPDVIEAVIVGNEVLLRGEMSAPELARTIRDVKARVPVRVTYADVWEFWLRYRELASAVDFITIHILPYWEDFPIPAREAAHHVESIRRQVIAAFPDKEIFLGEFGWPSAGRMREGALPSPVNEARTLHEVVALARRENYRANVIEAYDQPWKRKLEGTVGGHWGLFDAYQRQPKFAWGGAVSNHPHWRWQAAGGVAFAAIVFVAAWSRARRVVRPVPARSWSLVALNALVSGTLIGWTIENVPLESLTVGDWMRSLAWVTVALASPVLGAAALASAEGVPRLAQVIGRGASRARDPLALSLGVLLVLLILLAVQAALGLVFDPRYRDFPFAPLTGGVIPFLMLAAWPRRADFRLSAETIAAATLALSAIYILFNETFANWQSVWFCAGLFALAISLLPARDAPS